MARTPALSNYRTTKVPKPKIPGATNSVNDMSTINVSNVDDASGGNSNPLSAYANNTPSTNTNNSNPITSSATHEGTVNMGNNMSADITNASKEPVNSDLNYYQQLANLSSRNDLLVEKYGLQSYRDEAVSQMAQQDVARQQSEKALREQMRATGLNSGALSETMQGNLLMNYNSNIKDINSDYTNKVSNEVKTIQDQNYEVLENDLIGMLESDEAGQMDFTTARNLYNQIMNADISASQKQQLIKNYGLDPTQYLAKGVTANDDGTFNFEGLTLPAEFEGLVGNEETLNGIMNTIKGTYTSLGGWDDMGKNSSLGTTFKEVDKYITGEESTEERFVDLVDKARKGDSEAIEHWKKLKFLANLKKNGIEINQDNAKQFLNLYNQYQDQKAQVGEEAWNNTKAKIKEKVDNASNKLKNYLDSNSENIKTALEKDNQEKQAKLEKENQEKLATQKKAQMDAFKEEYENQVNYEKRKAERDKNDAAIREITSNGDIEIKKGEGLGTKVASMFGQDVKLERLNAYSGLPMSDNGIAPDSVDTSVIHTFGDSNVGIYKDKVFIKKGNTWYATNKTVDDIKSMKSSYETKNKEISEKANASLKKVASDLQNYATKVKNNYEYTHPKEVELAGNNYSLTRTKEPSIDETSKMTVGDLTIDTRKNKAYIKRGYNWYEVNAKASDIQSTYFKKYPDLKEYMERPRYYNEEDKKRNIQMVYNFWDLLSRYLDETRQSK